MRLRPAPAPPGPPATARHAIWSPRFAQVPCQTHSSTSIPSSPRTRYRSATLPLSRVLLIDDRTYPWLLLVPRRRGVSEITDLGAIERAHLMTEITQVADALKAETDCHKLNIAALGNVVPQLHVHIIARFRDDAAWPRPVWGQVPATRYDRGREGGCRAQGCAAASGSPPERTPCHSRLPTIVPLSGVLAQSPRPAPHCERDDTQPSMRCSRPRKPASWSSPATCPC